MPLTNYPNGLTSFGIPVVGSGDGLIPVTFTGTYFYVSSVTGNAAYNGTDPSTPMATIMQAHAKCTSGANDVIVLLKGHAETLTSASAINITKAGITIVGGSTGTTRAAITLGAAAATIAVNAANTTFKNISFIGGFADVVTCFVVEATGFTCDGCSFKQSAVDLNFLSLCRVGVSTTANVADQFTWINNLRYEIDAASLADISFLANTTDVNISNNISTQGCTGDVGHFIIAAALVLLNIRVIGNHLVITSSTTTQAVGLFMTTSSSTSTGIIAWNTVFSRDTTTALFDTASTSPIAHHHNYVGGALDTQSTLHPAADNPA